MKKRSIIIFALSLCLAAGGLFGLDLVQKQTVEQPPRTEPELLQESVVQIEQVTQVPGLPDDKWREGESLTEDEVWRFDLEEAYYYNDTDYLLYGVSQTADGWQGKIFRMADGAEPEQLCIWPEDSLYENDYYLSGYYLSASQQLVLYNQRLHSFLVYDNVTGQTQEFAVPDSLELNRDDQAFWLGDGRYLLTRFEQDPKELQRITHFINLYDEKTGNEVRLAKMDCPWCLFMPPTVQKPDRWLLLGTAGDLLEVTLPANSGEVKVQQRRAYVEWPTSVPWLFYSEVQPVQNVTGDYVVLHAVCEDGSHYQIVNLSGGLLGECTFQDKQGGGLLAAYGDTIYFSEHFAGDSQDACRIVACNYADNASKIIFGTETDGLTEQYPGLWNFEKGAISSDGQHLLILADDYVVKLRLVPDATAAD